MLYALLAINLALLAVIIGMISLDLMSPTPRRQPCNGHDAARNNGVQANETSGTS